MLSAHVREWLAVCATLLVLLCAACTKSRSTNDQAGATRLHTEARWWLVVDANHEQSTIGGSVSTRDDEIVFIGPNGQVNRKPVRLERENSARLEWTLAGTKHPVILDIEADADRASLTIGDSDDSLKLRLAAVASDRAKELDTKEASHRPPPDACGRAEACCIVAAEAVGRKCNADSELGIPHDPEICVRFSQQVRQVFTSKGLPLPTTCQ